MDAHLDSSVLSMVRDVVRSCSDELYVSGGSGEMRLASADSLERDVILSSASVSSSAENHHRVEAMERRLRETIASRKRVFAKRDADFERTMGETIEGMGQSLGQLREAMVEIRVLEEDMEEVRRVARGDGAAGLDPSQNVLLWSDTQTRLMLELVLHVGVFLGW